MRKGSSGAAAAEGDATAPAPRAPRPRRLLSGQSTTTGCVSAIMFAGPWLDPTQTNLGIPPALDLASGGQSAGLIVGGAEPGEHGAGRSVALALGAFALALDDAVDPQHAGVALGRGDLGVGSTPWIALAVVPDVQGVEIVPGGLASPALQGVVRGQAAGVKGGHGHGRPVVACAAQERGRADDHRDADGNAHGSDPRVEDITASGPERSGCHPARNWGGVAFHPGTFGRFRTEPGGWGQAR